MDVTPVPESKAHIIAVKLREQGLRPESARPVDPIPDASPPHDLQIWAFRGGHRRG